MTARILPPNRRVAPPRVAVEPPPAREPAPAGGEPRGEASGSMSWSLSPRAIESIKAVAGILLTVALALACVWGLVRYTRTSPRFALKNVEVRGGMRRSADDVARAAGLVTGQNVFAVSLDGARARLLEDPWIEKATVTRRLPSTVVVEIAEREAAAILVLSGDPWLVTRDGEPFKRLDAGDPWDFPVVTGVLAGDLARDRKGALDAIRRGLSLAGDWERTSVAKRFAVQEIHVDDDGSYTLVVGKDAVSLHMGRGPFRLAVDEASRVLAEAQSRKIAPAVVFVDHPTHPERVVVRMR